LKLKRLELTDMCEYLLNYYYPERTVAVSSRDPDYITPTIKAKLLGHLIEKISLTINRARCRLINQ